MPLHRRSALDLKSFVGIQHEDYIGLHTRKAKISQSTLVSLEMIIDTESLVILFQCTEFAQEREVFTRVLK